MPPNISGGEYSLNVCPPAAGIIEGTLDRHSPEINGGFVWEDAIAMQPGSGNDDVAYALVLAEEGGVLVEQRQDRLATL